MFRSLHMFHSRHHDPRHHDHHAGRHGGRHHGFPGFGDEFAGDFPEFGGRGRSAFGRGRKLNSADLQLLLLALLAEKPRHGYELIKALEEKSSGYYSPSPGMIYPALTYLEEIGHATVQAEGAKKLYSITEAGVAHLESRRAVVDALLQQLAWIGERMDQVRRAMSSRGEDAGDEDFEMPRGRHGRFGEELRSARHALKHALIEKIRATPEQQALIAKILEKAAADIRAL